MFCYISIRKIDEKWRNELGKRFRYKEKSFSSKVNWKLRKLPYTQNNNKNHLLAKKAFQRRNKIIRDIQEGKYRTVI